jgi:ketosteroid isomerase-like protein
MVDYAARLGARDIEGYVALFAEDGIWQNGDIIKKGHEEIRGLLLGMYGDPNPNYVNNEMYMLVSNIQIEVDGDRATAKSRQLTIRRGEGGRPTPVLNGLYEDEFIRENGEWKILHRIDNVIMPSREEWAQYMAQRRAEQEQQGK